jgi:hypothetical protein
VKSLVSSDISPSVTTQRQHQSNVLMVASLIKMVREKTLWGKPSPVTMSYLLAKSVTGDQTQWAEANGPIRSGI